MRAPAAAAGARARPAARALALPAVALTAAGAVLIALQLVLSARITGPVIVADEFGYLGAARWLAGAEGVPLLGPSPFYWPGYALLLAPLQALLGDPATVYRAAQLMNAVLVAAHLAPLFALARGVLGLDRGRAALVALAAGAYPAFLLQSGFAWTESLVPLLVTCWVLAVAGLAARPTAARAAGAAALAGAMYVTHPRLIGVALVTAALLVLLPRGGRLSGLAALSAGALMAAAVAGTHALNRVMADRIYIPGYPGASSRDAVEALGSAEGWANLGLAVAGQAWYLCVATLGLAPIGALWLARRARPGLRALRRGGEADPPAVAAFAALALAGSAFAISCVWMAANFARPDKLVYGRYNDAFVAVLLAAGLAALLRASARRRVAGLLGAAALLVALGAIVRLGHGAGPLDGPFSPVTVLGVMPLVRGVGMPVIAVSLVAALLIAGLAILAARAPRAAVAALVALFALAALDVSDRHVRPFAETRNDGFPLRSLADDLAGLGPISYDRSDSVDQAADDFALFAYQWWFDANPLRFYRASEGELPSTDLVMADARPPADGARRVAGADPALWVLPGPAEDALVRRGVIPPG
jgi:hypothetical protein